MEIEPLHIYLLRGLPLHAAIAHHRAYVRNIAYSLQYIDHLLRELESPTLKRTLHSQACKSVVVVGMGVVEAILWYLLLTTGKARTRTWVETLRRETQTFDQGGNTLRIVNVIEKKLDPAEIEEMTLDAMVKRAEKNLLLGSLGHAVYGHLRTLRQLRNKVHIHAVSSETDTDWTAFTGREVILLLDALRAILLLDLFQPRPEHRNLLAFLASSRVERRA